jgi:hypothetical protein
MCDLPGQVPQKRHYVNPIDWQGSHRINDHHNDQSLRIDKTIIAQMLYVWTLQLPNRPQVRRKRRCVDHPRGKDSKRPM